jgi:hypothetical protein
MVPSSEQSSGVGTPGWIDAPLEVSRLGIAESVAMKITGHKTTSIFKRYDITDESDLIEVAARLDEKRQLLAEQKSQAAQAEFGQSLGRVAPKAGNPQTAPSLAPRPN